MVSLDLGGKGLQGPLAGALAEVQLLKEIHLAFNQLTGEGLGASRRLCSTRIARRDFPFNAPPRARVCSAHAPYQSITELPTFAASAGLRLSGTLPPEWSNQPLLQVIDVSHNR